MANWHPVPYFLVELGLLLVAPFAVAHGFLFVEYRSSWRYEPLEMPTVLVGVAVGVLGIWLIPIKGHYLARGVAAFLYAVVMSVAVSLSLFAPICAYFGQCP